MFNIHFYVKLINNAVFSGRFLINLIMLTASVRVACHISFIFFESRACLWMIKWLKFMPSVHTASHHIQLIFAYSRNCLFLQTLLFQLQFPLGTYKIHYVPQFLLNLELIQRRPIKLHLKLYTLIQLKSELFCLQYFFHNFISHICCRFYICLLRSNCQTKGFL